jgi:hypothetical protein
MERCLRSFSAVVSHKVPLLPRGMVLRGVADQDNIAE